jgi:hypothetical protein
MWWGLSILSALLKNHPPSVNLLKDIPKTRELKGPWARPYLIRKHVMLRY